MQQVERVPHWLRPNAAARMPRRVVCFDSEAGGLDPGPCQEQTFRLAVASFDALDAETQHIEGPQWGTFTDTGELWRWVGEHTHPKLRTVCFAHNLSYDLRLTGALEHLPDQGWELRQATIGDYSCWCYLVKNGRSLYLVDSLSYLPGALDALAKALKRRRPRLPDPDAELAELERRCRADVRVLREAILWLLGALHDEDLGDFRTTGAAQASAAFRHRFLRRRSVLVHADERLTVKERRACWAGRAEVWRWGKHRGPLYEWDYTNAYCRIGLETKLPVRPHGRGWEPSLELYDQLRERYACLAEVEVETQTPVLPAEHAGRILWPVGTFTTTAWDVELEAARKAGAKLTVRWLQPYQREPVLAEWAAWILDGLDGEHFGAHPLGRLVLKHWSRALVGRFGLRYPLLQRLGELPWSDVKLYPVFDRVEGRDYQELQIGRVVYEQTEKVEAPNATPFLMGAVMAECRVRLWEAMQVVGDAELFSVDTDGLIVTAEGERRLRQAVKDGRLAGLRRKATYRRGDFRGPRNLQLDEQRRVSGVPKRATELEPGQYRGEVWESLPAALRHRRTNSVLVYERQFTVSDDDPRRRHLPDGWTDAVELGDELPQLLAAG